MNYFCIGLLLLANYVSAQSVITGKITDAKNQSVPYINITLHERNTTTILAFAITDAAGRYSIKYTSNADSLQLKVYGMGFATQTKMVDNRAQEVNLQLQEKYTELKEVVIKETPITRSGDTLSYSVNTFKTHVTVPLVTSSSGFQG
ncbi:MAG: carboxypeptidase-like regulatory domain-containing protein [Spirosomataceae bacterium]